MEPYIAKKLPLVYKFDKELLRLLAEANEKYGQYKSLLKLFRFDPRYFLDSIILGESLQSSRIEGTQVSQDDMYYIDYISNSNFEEIKNLKKMIAFAKSELNNPINLKFINKMHFILLSGVRGKEKNPGVIRITQNYIGKIGLGKEGATFIPPIPEDVPLLLENLFEYMNDKYIDEIFINLAISHFQFETIHPYSDGNGRLGRALIPIQLAKFKNEEPILFLSEIIELYKSNYYNALNEGRDGNIEGFIKFFLRCVIDQCFVNINRIERINTIYNEDFDTICSNIKGNGVHKILPIMLKKIVFTTKEVTNETKLHINSVTSILNKLVNLNILVKEKKFGSRITYKYKRVYDEFVIPSA